MNTRKVAEARMTDPDSILQLGIEAAREGNKDEARNLFRLLTSEDSQNVQAWLWLAGVSESIDERRAALERVLEIDPNNDMATKSLQALEGSSSPAQAEMPPSGPAGVPPTSPEPSSPPAEYGADEGDFDDPFAELDALSDVMAEDTRAVGRPEATEPEETSAKSQISSVDETHKDTSPAASTSSSAAASQTRQEHRPSSTESRKDWSSKEEGRSLSMAKGSSGGVNLRLVALVLAVVVVVMGVVFVVWPMFFGKPQTAPAPQPAAQQQPANGGEEQAPPSEEGAEGSGVDGEAAQPTSEPADAGEEAGAEQPAPEQPGVATSETPQEAPTAEAQPAQPTQPAQPAQPTQPAQPADGGNVQVIPPNNPLESSGWLYDFNQQMCGGNSCATPWRTNIGSFQAKGRFVIVLVMVVNNTGQEQPLPADFLVLQDAQGRTYNTLPQVSSAYVTPGVQADRSHEQPIPANGIATSVALVFDVSTDATDLVLYAPSGPAQGWLILQNVQ